MNYLQRKKLALMMNRKFKGYLRTVSGVPLTLTDCIGSELVSLSVIGSAEGVGERTANLFDMKAIDGYVNNLTFEYENGKLYAEHTGNANYSYLGSELSSSVLFNRLQPLTVYRMSYKAKVLSGTIIGSSLRVVFVDSSDTVQKIFYIATPTELNQEKVLSHTWTTPEDISVYNKILIYGATNGVVEFSDIQVTEGAVEADYEPYGYKIPLTVSGENENKAYNIYSDTPLYGTEGEEYTVPAITTFKGTTIITPETSVQPTDMTAQYYASKP